MYISFCQDSAAALRERRVNGKDEAGRPTERGARKLKKSKRQTCQSIGRMLRVNVSMVTKPFIL